MISWMRISSNGVVTSLLSLLTRQVDHQDRTRIEMVVARSLIFLRPTAADRHMGTRQEWSEHTMTVVLGAREVAFKIPSILPRPVGQRQIVDITAGGALSSRTYGRRCPEDAARADE